MKSEKSLRVSINSFDAIKGLGMLCIVMYHMAFHYPFEELALPLQYFLRLLALASGAMPLFFMVSGYGFRPKPVKKFLLNSFQGLLKPYFIVVAVFSVLYPVLFRLWWGEWAYGFYETKRFLIAFLLGIPKPGKELFGLSLHHCSAMWFFLTSFIASNLLNLIVKIKPEKLQLPAVLLLSLAGYVMLLRDFNFYCMGQGFAAVGYFYLGMLMKKYDLIRRGIGSAVTYTVLVPASLLFVVFGGMDLCQGYFRNGFIDLAGAAFVSALLMYFGVWLNQRENKIVSALSVIGSYTYWIICIHVVENDCMQWFAYSAAVSRTNLAFLGELAGKALIITAACVLLNKLAQLKYRRRFLTHEK